MLTAIQPITWEEFWQLPDPPNGGRYELHDGVPVIVPPAHLSHTRIQFNLVELLMRLSSPSLQAGMEFPFGPGPGRNYWIADVVLVNRERLNEDHDLYPGPPDLIVEVESPSNRGDKLDRREATCLQNGGKEFWIVFPRLRTVRVSTPTSVEHYGEADLIPRSVVPGAFVAVKDIFELRR